MFRTVLLLCAVLSLLGAGSAWRDLGAANRETELKNLHRAYFSEYSDRTERQQFTSWSPRATDVLDRAIEFSKRSNSSVETLQIAARWLRFNAEAEHDVDKKILRYCHSLSLFGQAIKKEPFSAALLLQWSNIKQIIGAVNCDEPFTKGSLGEVVSTALHWNPTHATALYGAGLLAVWDDERDEALGFFNKMIALSRNLNDGQRKVISSQLKSGADFAKLVPAKLIHVASWSEYVKAGMPFQFSAWRSEIGVVQLRSIDESKERYLAGKLPGEIFSRQLYALEPLAATSTVRRKIDKELGAVLLDLGQIDASRYFKARDTLEDLRFVATEMVGDSRPYSTSLVGWARNPIVYLDDFYQSLGFYLGRDQYVKMIALHSTTEDIITNHPVIRVLVSADNSKWEELPVSGFNLVRINERSILFVTFPAESHRYWKINFPSSKRQHQFAGKLYDLVRVFGQTRK